MQPSAGNMLTMLQGYIKRDKIILLEHKRIPISALLVKRIETEEAKSDEGRFIS
jgi:hypothetical protein